MRAHCKQYVLLYKKKFNGHASVIPWRKGMPGLTEMESEHISTIELLYPADKVVNFRLMAHAELRTEMALNKCMNAESVTSLGGGGNNAFRRSARELTPLEQLHLHGQNGYGINIYRGLPPPPSSIKIRVDLQSPYGLWWSCALNKRTPTALKSRSTGKAFLSDADCWVIAIDCTAQPFRVLLSDNIVDTSVFMTMEVPAAPPGQRPLAVLLGRSMGAFANGSPGRIAGGSTSSGGSGWNEWSSILEFDGTTYLCMQLKTVLTSSVDSPWDIFTHFSCGDVLGHAPTRLGERSNFSLDAIRLPGVPSPDRGSPGCGTKVEPNACIRLRLPFLLASGQVGPCFDFLKQVIAQGKASRRPFQIQSGPLHSTLAWLAQCINTGLLAMFRLHVRLPPLMVESVGAKSSVRFPRLDAACHFEHGGLIDGFVAGLHNLRNFIAAHLLSAGPAVSEQVNGVKDPRTGSYSLSLEALEQVAPLWLIVSIAATACGATLASHAQMKQGTTFDSALTAMMRKHELVGLLANVGTASSANARAGAKTKEPGLLASLTLATVVMAIAMGRRAVWDCVENKKSGNLKPSGTSAAAVASVHGFAASVLRSLLLLGVPLHPRCLCLAAWAGSREILEAIAVSRPADQVWPPPGLIIWAARGAYVNLQPRQEELVRWLIGQRAQIDERDADGWSLLEWACWSGAETLVSLALRAGLLATGPVTAAGSSASGVQPLRIPPSPMTLAVASRSQVVVAMMLRAGCDPHVPPVSQRSCGPLLFAVQKGEYTLACQLMQGCPFVAIDAALCTGAEQSCNIDVDDASPKAYGSMHATVVLIDSFRRFARALSPRNGEEPMLAMSHSGVRNLPTLGPHSDDGLYATGKAHFTGILHPVLLELPRPKLKVGHEFRPQHPPHWWVQRSSRNPWYTAYSFIECCLHNGFRPDAAVVSQALPMLPSEAKRVVQHLVIGATTQAGYEVAPQGFDTARALRQFKLVEMDDSSHRSPCGFDRSPDKSMGPVFGGTYETDAAILPERVVETLETCFNDYGSLQEPGTEVFSEISAFAGDAGVLPEQGNGEAVFHGAKAWNAGVLGATVAQNKRPMTPSALPSLRVVVLGSPRVGKTRVAQCLHEGIGIAAPPEDLLEHVDMDRPAWMTTQMGAWPAGGNSRLNVHVWDGSAAPVQGLLRRMAADPAVALLIVWVVDADVEGGASRAEAVAGECLKAAGATSSTSAPRRALVVENVFPSSGSPPKAGKMTKINGTCYRVLGDMEARDGRAQLSKGFGLACQDIADALRSWRPEAIGKSLPGFRDAKDAARIAASLRGDAGLVDPSSVTWAWAAVRASVGFLAEGAAYSFLDEGRGPSRCDGAMVSMERLSRVLTPASTQGSAERSTAAAGYLRALADMGLACPIPSIAVDSSKEMTMPYPGCSWVLLPDFARRVPLTADKVTHFAGLYGGTKEKKVDQGGQAPMAVRILWDGPGSVAPSMRTMLRDFLAHGVLACGCNTANARSIDICQFSVLESGPSGTPSQMKADDLAPGFFLVFDLVQSERHHGSVTPSERSVSDNRTGVAKPPSSVKITPSGDMPKATTPRELQAAAEVRPNPTIPSNLTVLIVAAADAASDREASFCDVYCSGPHAQWAWRALLGNGAGGPNFSAFQRLRRPLSASKNSACPTWPLPPPPFVLSSRTATPASVKATELPTSYELLGLSWIFNGPQGELVRPVLLPQEDILAQGALQACCSALCGKTQMQAAIDLGGIDGAEGLAICSDFEASLTTRNWRTASRFLEEALASGLEPWTLCSAALARLAHDIAAATSGTQGRTLPLLFSSQSVAAVGSARSVELIPDGPLPIMNKTSFQTPQQPVASLKASPGLDAWLKVCRPAALWSLAGRARGFQAANALQPAGASDKAPIGDQVADALQMALTIKLSEEQISEVWESLGELISKGSLVRRADSTWAMTVDADNFLL